MEIKTNSMINNEANDEYFIPIQPDHAVALTMNFPQFSEPIQSKASLIQTDFDYNCPDCLADLFGPLMAPYAVLQKQSDAYRLRLEYIAYQRYLTMKSYLFDSFEKDFKTRWKSTFRHPFKYDIKGFLPRKAAIGRYISMILSGWVFIIGIGILIFAIYLIFITDHRQPMATLIRTLISTLCILLGAFVCSFLLTLSGILIVLMASALTIILPIIFIFSKSVFITKLERYMRVSIRDYDDIPENPITIFWTELQLKYSCCGLDNPISDYRESYFHTLTGEDVPASCCTNGTSCTSSPTITNSFIDQSCLPQAKSFVDSAIQVASIGHIVLGTLLLFILISVGVFFLYMKSAKKALDRYNQFIIKSMVSTFEQYEKEIGVFKNAIPEEINFHNKQQIRGILPITPTVIRVKNPRIMNYFGFD
ncbi:unnamed protein product [Rotaria magnacalcarata]|uniref:Tetraspanin n=1 Tax=Rotaria magnacalcarata TaxID=392030 RepID=A0A819LX06_9BILA|nr:unnamed protein product [Rotaria magnacalcarata]CAF4119684.1 unnamed protein product [Rotaria magnacalcarata]